MRIICPYYPEVSPQTKEALKDYDVDYVKLDNGLGYWRLLKSLWEKPEDVIIVEHDVVPWMGAIEQLETCDHDYCGYGYTEEGKEVNFGCAKLTAKHMSQIPNLWDKMLLRNWRDCHGHHGEGYEAIGVKPYQHAPHVMNTNSIRST